MNQLVYTIVQKRKEMRKHSFFKTVDDNRKLDQSYYIEYRACQFIQDA